MRICFLNVKNECTNFETDNRPLGCVGGRFWVYFNALSREMWFGDASKIGLLRVSMAFLKLYPFAFF